MAFPWGVGLPLTILRRVLAARYRVIATKASISRLTFRFFLAKQFGPTYAPTALLCSNLRHYQGQGFTVVLLCERVRTVIHCLRLMLLSWLVTFRRLFGIRKLNETEICLRGF